MKSLNPRQQATLDGIGPDWGPAPFRSKSATLLSLSERGLIEGRRTRPLNTIALCYDRYTGSGYEWRRRPAA